MSKTVVEAIHPHQTLLDLLSPYIAELDRYPRPNRIDPRTGMVTEYGSPGDQHCPTMPMSAWNELVSVEPFKSHADWEHLRQLKKEAVGASREIPGIWLRAAYNLIADREG